MKFQQTDPRRGLMLLMLALTTSCGSAWASSNGCPYPRSGTGMGGTGTIAKGTGIGGTGISPEAGIALQRAGNVIFSQGAVEAQYNGNTRPLSRGDAVCVGETIVTAQSGMARMRMADDATVAVSPLTQLKIIKYTYAGTSKDGSLFDLLRGTGRFITGRIGKAYPQNDLIHTPNATIGVLGTDHEATVILPAEKAGYPAGTYDKVNSGITFIRTDKGRIDIYPNQVGFAADIGESPALLKEIPGFYQTNPSASQEGSPSREEKHTEGAGGAESSGQTGEERLGTEPETPHGDHPEVPEGMGLPEAPTHPEVPEHPELPEPPAHPEFPEPLHPEAPGQVPAPSYDP